MGGIARGTEEIAKKNKEIEKQRGGNSYVPELFLGAGELARVRIIEDISKDKLPFSFWAHKIFTPGEKKKQIIRYCTSEDDVGEVCPWCDQGTGRTRMFMLWVWVYFKLHKSNNQEGTWEAVKYRNGRYFEDLVARPMILRRGHGKADAMYEKFANLFLEYGTWFDRDIIWSRNEATRWQDTDYFVIPKDPSEIDPIIDKIGHQLPDLADVATGIVQRIPRFDANGDVVVDEEKEKEVEATGGERVVDDDEVTSPEKPAQRPPRKAAPPPPDEAPASDDEEFGDDIPF